MTTPLMKPNGHWKMANFGRFIEVTDIVQERAEATSTCIRISNHLPEERIGRHKYLLSCNIIIFGKKVVVSLLFLFLAYFGQISVIDVANDFKSIQCDLSTFGFYL